VGLLFARMFILFFGGVCVSGLFIIVSGFLFLNVLVSQGDHFTTRVGPYLIVLVVSLVIG